MFPRSETPPRHGLFFFLFSIPFGLFAVGVEMTNKYVVVQWMFILTAASSAITAYIFFVIFSPAARKFWTSMVALIVGVGLFYLYGYLCPTVTIRPSHPRFAAEFSGADGVSETANFRIQNRVDDDLYGVVFKLRVEAPSTKEHFQVAAPESRRQDIAIQICTDLHNRPVFQGVIARLYPNDSQVVTLTHVNVEAEKITPSSVPPPRIEIPDHEREITVNAKIVSFNSAEDQLHRPGLKLTKFYNDETLTCNGIVVGSK
jgi:hypothetical protein